MCPTQISFGTLTFILSYLILTDVQQSAFGKAAERKKRAREDEVKKKVEEVLERAKQVSFRH